jgi:DNA-binding transcriptional LysR family regulator
MGIGPYKDVPERLVFKPLLEQPFFLILPADHALARRGHIEFRELEGLPLLFPATGTTARALLEGAARSAGISLHAKYEALQHQTLVSMVSAGLGVTVMPLTDRRVLTALGLVALPFQDIRLHREVGVISRRHEQLSPPATAFLRLLLIMSGSDQAIGETGLRALSFD